MSREQVDLIRDQVEGLADELEELLDGARWQEVDNILNRLLDGEANIEELCGIAEDLHEKWEPVREQPVSTRLEKLSVDTGPSEETITLGTGRVEIVTIYTPADTPEDIDEGDDDFHTSWAFGEKIGLGEPNYVARVNLESGGVSVGSTSWIGGDEGNALIGIPVIVANGNTDVTITVTIRYITATTNFLAGFTETSVASVFEGEWEERVIDPPFSWKTTVKLVCPVLGVFHPALAVGCFTFTGLQLAIDSLEFVELAQALSEIEGVEEREITYNLGTMNAGCYAFSVGLHARTNAAVVGISHALAFGQVTKIEVRQQVPSYDLTVASTGGGSVTTPEEGTHTYDAGTVVDLVATWDPGYYFVSWTGDNVNTIADVYAPATTITMNDDYSITANFEEIPAGQVILTVTSTAGGSVTTPEEGTHAYDAGTVVDLVAEVEETDYEDCYFVNWSGDVDTVANINDLTTTITMNDNYSITANFASDNIAFGKPTAASSTWTGYPPENAVDGSLYYWNSGDFPPGWIEVDLQATCTIGRIRLTVMQNPLVAETVHQVLGKGPGTGGDFQLLHEFHGITENNQQLEYTPATPWEDIQFIKILTVTSPSWVAWREIEIWAP